MKDTGVNNDDEGGEYLTHEINPKVSILMKTTKLLDASRKTEHEQTNEHSRVNLV